VTGHMGHRRGAASPLRCRAGTPTRLRRPHTARRLACQSGCHLGPSAVKGRCALMSARYAFGVPLTAPGPGWRSANVSPGWG
jgi:hypothetical protein